MGVACLLPSVLPRQGKLSAILINVPGQYPGNYAYLRNAYAHLLSDMYVAPEGLADPQGSPKGPMRKPGCYSRSSCPFP
jgi:hypothetical protein